MKRKNVTVDFVDLMLGNGVSFSFPQVYKALFLFATIPFTVAAVETFFQAQIV